MLCTSCGKRCPPGAKFCQHCGADLPPACTGCNQPLDPDAKFCSQCGLPAPDAHKHDPGQRRQLTVMFCDLVGSTELSLIIDAEDLRDIMWRYHQRATGYIEQNDGYVAQFLGDGVLAYFGYPQAHEDDAERAVTAALGLQAEMRTFNDEREAAGEAPIHARVGIHTGMVVISDVDAQPGRQETLAVGDTVNIAARLEGAARPGTVRISEVTERLIRGRFVLQPEGPQTLKGVTTTLDAFTVVEAIADTTAFGHAGSRSQFVGREEELSRCRTGWETVQTSGAQTLVLTGELGVGKSRLLHEIKVELESTPHLLLETSCSRLKSGSAFQPWIELVEGHVRYDGDEDPGARLAKFESAMIALLGDDAADVVPYVGVLLGLPESERFPLGLVGPELQREKTLLGLISIVEAVAEEQPVALICEDIHWADPSSIEVFGQLASAASALPILTMLTSRDGLPADLAGVQEVHLGRLTLPQTLDIIRSALPDGVEVSDEVLHAVAARADGVPLFAEELAKFIAEGDSEVIPTTLQDSLMGRLDRLGDAKYVAQLGATIGRTFSHSLIDAVSDTGSDTLQQHLDELVAAHVLLVVDGTEPGYVFQHALLQESAYESLLRRTRHELHGLIATTLRGDFPQISAQEPELVAHHCAAGGQITEAVDYYKLAGEQVVARVAYAEAYGHFHRALELLGELPEDGARDAREITLRIAEAAPLAALRGYESDELKATIARVEELCRDIDDAHRLGALMETMLYLLERGLLPRARDYATTLLPLAEPLGIPQLSAAVHMIKGVGAITASSAIEACDELQTAADLMATAEMPPPAGAFDMDSQSLVHCTHAIALAAAGRPESAMRSIERGLERATRLDHPRTLASSLQHCATSHFLMGNAAECGQLSQRGIEVVEGRGYHTVEVSARALAGWAAAKQGDPLGLAAMDDALANAESKGVVGGMTNLYCAASELHGEAGDFDTAFTQLSKGEALMVRNGEEAGYQSMALVSRARIMHNMPDADLRDVERLVIEALDLMDGKGGLARELAGAIYLGELTLETRRPPQFGLDRLQAVYAQLTEGFELPLAQRARVVIGELEAVG